MPESKHAHYLPATYLRYFSTDPAHCGRNSWIWRVVEDRQHRVQVDSQCSAEYHFTRTRETRLERQFQESERRYARWVDKIRAGNPLSVLESSALLAVMLDFHLRNAVPGTENGENDPPPSKARNRTLLAGVLLGDRAHTARTADVARHLDQHWNLSVVTPPEGHHFLTSDCPSVWLSLEPAETALHIVLLPLTPRHLAIACDKRALPLLDKPLTVEDARLLNSAQIGNATRALYSSTRIPDDHLADLRQLWSRLSALPPSSASGRSDVRLLRLPREHHYSFIRPAPPLM